MTDGNPTHLLELCDVSCFIAWTNYWLPRIYKADSKGKLHLKLNEDDLEALINYKVAEHLSVEERLCCQRK